MSKPIIAILDTGIDSSLPVFKRPDGSSRIIAYYDVANQFYTTIASEIPKSPFAEHGTKVAYAALRKAPPEADLLIICISSLINKYASNTAIIMTAIDYALRFATYYDRPLIINLSYGSDNGPHNGKSLLEQYIDFVSYDYRACFTIAAGNHADNSRHANLINNACEFFVGNMERNFNMYSIFDTLAIPKIRLSSPDGSFHDLQEGYQTFSLYGQRISCVLSGPTPYTMLPSLNISIRQDGTNPMGIWRLDTSHIDDNTACHLWIYESDSLISDCYFLKPDSYQTITIPGTAKSCICVGLYDDETGLVAPYSGRGYAVAGYVKPDLASVNGGGINELSPGTSFAAPYVAGIISSIIAKADDPYLYGERLRSALLSQFTKNISNITPEMGYAIIK